MAIRKVFLLAAVTVIVAAMPLAFSDEAVDLDIDGAVAAVEADPEAKSLLEQECIAVLASEPEWPELYRAVRILTVIGGPDSVAPLAALLEDANTAHLARYALESMPYPEVDALLLDAFKEAPRKTRLGIISTLAVRKNKDAVPMFTALLPTEDRQVLENVTLALGILGGSEAEQMLEEFLRSDHETLDLLAAKALLVLAEGLTDAGKADEATNHYQRLLEPQWPDHVRAGAFMGILAAMPNHATDAILQVLRGEDMYMRRTAIAAVASLPGAGITQRFSSEFEDLPAETQAPLLESLAQREDLLDVNFLFGRLNDDRPEIRLAAMRALSDHGDENAIAPLGAVLEKSESRAERLAAIETLRRLRGEEVDAALIRYMENAPPEQRPDLIEALVQRSAVSAVDALIAQTQVDSVRAAAFRGLGQLMEGQHLNVLLGLLADLEGDAGRGAAEAAVIALVRKAGLGEGALKINKALYGDLPDGEYVDVTHQIESSIRDGALSITASNDTFGDAAPNVVKSLLVEYTLNGVKEQRSVREGGALNIVAEIISPDVVNSIAAALEDVDRPEAKGSFLRVLSRLGGRHAFDFAAAYLNNDAPEIHDAAVRAVASWPDGFAAQTLAGLFVQAQDTAHRNLTLRGAVRLLRMGEYPLSDTMALYEQLMAAAATPDERKIILSGLGEVPAPEAVVLAYTLRGDASVEAEVTLALEQLEELLGAEAFSAAVTQADAAPVVDETFISIFDGETLNGWSGDPAFWRVEDGSIIGETREDAPVEYNTFLVWEDGEVEDFDLRFRYRIDSEWANSGVQIRSERFDTWRVRGYQPDIATEDWITGICYEEGGRGILVRRGQTGVFTADGESEITQFGDEDALADYIYHDDWNEYHIQARGNRFYSRINGHKMHEIVDDAPEARRRGVIAFQLHTGPAMKIRFTDIMLRRSAPAETE